MGVILALLMAICVHVTHGLVGFDCGGRYLTVTTISLLDTGDCAPPTSTTNTTQVYIQLLQLSEYDHTDVLHCKIEISRTIYYCGMHSHVSVVHNGRSDYLMDVSQHSCMQMHKDGSLILGNGAVIDGLKVNKTTTRPVTLAGRLSMDGSCKGSQYSDPYGTWDDCYVTARPLRRPTPRDRSGVGEGSPLFGQRTNARFTWDVLRNGSTVTQAYSKGPLRCRRRVASFRSTH